MSTVIIVVAQYLLYVLVIVAGVVWLTCDRRGKVLLAAEAVVGLAVVGIGIWAAAALHADPRPFVHDPSSRPLFPHAADNGFPSDHSAAAGLLAALVFRYRRAVGVLVAAGGVLIAWARVAAHVHHAQDVVAGLLIGLVAGVLAIWVVERVVAALERRGMSTGARAVTTADKASGR